MKILTKKLLAIALVLTIVLQLVPAMVFAADSTETLEVSVETVTALPGDTVQVDIAFDKNPGISSFVASVAYDEMLTLTDVAFNGAFGSYTTTPKPYKNPQKITMISPLADMDLTGVFATLTFEVSKDASDAYDANITLEYEQSDIYNSDFDEVNVKIKNGKIKVFNGLPGDVNMDQKVNTKDAVLLFRYVAGWDVEVDHETLDANGDGYINTKDAVTLIRYVSGWSGIVLHRGGVCRHTSLQEVSAKEPTCTEDGNVAYWYCSECDKYFKDDKCNTEITLDDTVTMALGHTEVVDEAKTPTYTETGLTEGSHCSKCGTVIVAQEIVPILGATYHAIIYRNLQGAESPEITQFAEHEGVAMLPRPTLAGYEFIGWYTAPNGQGNYVNSIKAGTTEDVELHAYWEIETYTIYFYDAPENSNATASSNTTTYTVKDRIVLTDPRWSGLKFVNWTDENGKEYKEISKGTVGDIELRANWQLLENTAVPADGIRELWTDYDAENGHQIFVYELGEIQHVVLEELDRKYKFSGSSIMWEKNKTVSLDNGVSSEVSKTVSNSVSKTTQFDETNEWTESHSSTFERGFTVGIESEPIKKILSIKGEGSFNWSDTDENSWSHATTNSEGKEEAFEKTHSNSSTVTYNNTISESFTTSMTIDGNMPEGVYRYVYYGTVHVFAVVTYEPVSGNYRLDTYSVLSEEIGSMPLYVPPTGTTANIKTSDGLPCDFPLDEIEKFMADARYIKYEANGGEGTMLSSAFKKGEGVTLLQNKFSRPGYIFAGWSTTPDGDVQYADKALFTSAEQDEEMVKLYAVWEVDPYTISKYVESGIKVSDTHGKNSYTVYTSIDDTPWNTPSGKVIIDWSNETDTNLLNHTSRIVSNERYNNLDIGKYTTEIFFIGASSKKYTNFVMHLCGFEENQNFTLHFIDFNFVSNENTAIGLWEDKGVNLSIEITGNCSIGTNCSSGSIIGLPDAPIKKVCFIGNGTMNIAAGNGANSTTAGGNGGAGGTAIVAENVAIDMIGKMTIIGGNGGNGTAGVSYDGVWVDRSGTEGGKGGDGGNGGNAITSTTFTINNAEKLELKLVSGNGGNGADGGIGESSNWGSEWRGAGKGGDGGKGGNGGYILTATEILCDGELSSADITLGNGGNGGNGGRGGHADQSWFIALIHWSDPGAGGIGGAGGAQGQLGFELDDMNLDVLSVNYGTNGSSGSNGAKGVEDGK